MTPRTSWRAGSFFGIHYDLHAAATDTELGVRLTHEHLRAEVERLNPDWLQCDAKGHPGYTSYPTKVGSPSPGIVTDALRLHREVTAELGLPLVVHYSGLYDERAIELQPSWGVVNVDGTTDPMKICPLSAYRDELMIPQLLELVCDYGVDGIWVDGENWGAAPCWCERCQTAFAADAPSDAAGARWHDWLAFHRANVVAHVAAYCDAVHAASPHCGVTSNWLASSFQPEDVVPDLDWLSGDSAPGVSTLLNARAVDGRDRPWELMTWSFITPKPGHPITDMKSPAHLRQEVAVSMACGGGVVLYDLPDRSGHLTSWRQQELAELGTWCRARAESVQGTTSVPQVAVLQSERHHYLHSPPLFAPGDGDDPLRGAVHALLEMHASVDVINESDLARRGTDYRLIVVPEQEDLSAEAAAALEGYVRAGGRVLISGTRIAGVLPSLVGARPGGAIVEDFVLLRAGDGAIKVTGPWQPVEVREAEAVGHLLASWEPDDATADVVVTKHDLGGGRVVAVHGPLFAHHAEHHVPRCRDLVAELCALAGPDLDVHVDGPARLHVTLRSREETTIVHLVNMGGWHPLAAVTAHVAEVPPVGPITVRVRTERPPTSVRVVPAGELRWVVDAGWTTIELDDVDIHAALIIGTGDRD